MLFPLPPYRGKTGLSDESIKEALDEGCDDLKKIYLTCFLLWFSFMCIAGLIRLLL